MDRREKASFLPQIYNSTAKMSNYSQVRSSHTALRKLDVEPMDSE